MRIWRAAAVAALLLAPAAAEDTPTSAGTWYGEGQPGDPGVRTVEHHMADGRYSIQSVKCNGDAAEQSFEEGTWSNENGLTVIVTLSVDGEKVHLVDKYKDTLSDDGKMLSSTLVESSYAGAPVGFVFVMHRVADDFILPPCGATTS